MSAVEQSLVPPAYEDRNIEIKETSNTDGPICFLTPKPFKPYMSPELESNSVLFEPEATIPQPAKLQGHEKSQLSGISPLPSRNSLPTPLPEASSTQPELEGHDKSQLSCISTMPSRKSLPTSTLLPEASSTQPELEGHDKSQLSCISTMPSRKSLPTSTLLPEASSTQLEGRQFHSSLPSNSLPNLLPKTDYFGHYKERKEHLYQRSVSDSLDSPTLVAKVVHADNAPIRRSQNKQAEKAQTALLEKREEKLNQFLAENPLWQKKDGFEFKNDPHESIKIFYIQVNQLVIFGKSCNVCLLCTREKNEVKPKSHIFPEALLKLYAAIHCKNDQQFLYNLSDGEMLGPPGLSFPLFCNYCEVKASDEESLLTKVYLQAQSSDFESRLTFNDNELVHKLKHVLGILLFRGILLGIDFLFDIPKSHSVEFYETFLELRDYCCEKDCKAYQTKQISKRIHLSFLPNSPFNKWNIDPCYILDLQLRNPEFTSFVKAKGAVFLYTKFDCFHCTLSIGPTEIPALSESCCFSFCPDGDYAFPNEKEGIDYFPKLLLNFNLSRMETLSYHLFTLNNSAFMTCKCVIHLRKMKQWCPLSTKEKRSISVSESAGKNEFGTEGLDEAKKKKFIAIASGKSPFRIYHDKGFNKVYEEENKKVNTATEEKWKGKFEEKDEKLTKTLKQLSNEKRKNSEIQEKNNKLKGENKELAKQNKDLVKRNEGLTKQIEAMKQLHQVVSSTPQGDPIIATDLHKPSPTSV